MEGRRSKPGRRRRWPLITAACLLCALALSASPLFPFLRSLAVMGVYSKVHESRSLLAEEGIALRVPGGLSTAGADWYPFVMTFVADEGYAAFSGEEDARLTILYNFPAYDYTKGCSRLFDPDSPYYNGFYGAYLLRGESNASLAAGRLDAEVAAQVARFDFFHLVLGDFGLAQSDQIFDFRVKERRENVPYLGYEGWTKLDVDILVNGSAHDVRPGVPSYLQYGAPNFGPVSRPFAPVRLSGRVYGRYFPEWDVGIYLYVMGKEAVCDACDREILSRSRLESKG